MTSADQLHLRLEREAQRLREAGHHAAAHDWQHDADEFDRLAAKAEKLPPARKNRKRDT